jgi:hypothetical protein
MSTTNQIGEFITIDKASQMTSRYRASIQMGETIGYAISKEFITDILEQLNCEGLRIYMGINENNEKTLVINGIDKSGNDIYEGLIADGVWACPSFCSSINPLNS